jgi:hypothetical protein
VSDADKFQVGDSVVKGGGDYTFEGVVRSVFAKRSGAVRYVVENDAGILHIFSAGNLTHARSSPQISQMSTQSE